MLSTLAAGAVAVSSLAGPATPPPSTEMVIDVVTAMGSGCPQGTAQVVVSPDNRAFTVSYSKFIAQVGPQTNASDYRKNCQLSLDVLVPPGYTYAIAGADYRGYASLYEGVTASETAFYYFQGMQRSTRIRHDFAGRMEQDWQRSDRVELTAESFLPCGDRRYLNVNAELKVDATNAAPGVTNWISLDSTDGNLDTVYHVAWMKC